MQLTYKTTALLVLVTLGTAVACSGTDTSSSSSGAVPDPEADAGPVVTLDASPTPVLDGAAPKKDAGPPPEQPPSAPMLEVSLNGMAMSVKNVTIKGIPAQQGSIANYVLEGTLDKAQAFVTGLLDDPRITIEVGKDDQGPTACQVTRGPIQGFIEPVIELRKVTIRYKRFTGDSTVIAYPNTHDQEGLGSCSITLKSAASNGQAWGEAQGKVQAGTDEPVVNFQAKWFQTFKW